MSGMRLAAADGMCLDLPDTPGNAAEFGYPGNDPAGGRSRRSGCRAGECGTRAVLGAERPWPPGSRPARRLLAKLHR